MIPVAQDTFGLALKFANSIKPSLITPSESTENKTGLTRGPEPAQ